MNCIKQHIAHHKMVTVQSCTTRSRWEEARALLVHNMDKFAEVAKRFKFTKEHLAGEQCRPVTFPLLARIYPIQCWPKYEPAPISIPLLASISAVDLLLALGACYVLFSAWRSASSVPAGFLGISSAAQGAILVGYIFLSTSHGFLQHHAGSTGYPVIAATLLIYVGKIVVSLLMFLCKCDVRAGLSSLLAPGCARFGQVPAWVLPMIPGGLFACYDALSFTSLVNLDPATYQVLLYTRVIFVCFMWQVMFRRKLSTSQWLAALIFVTAGITKGFDRAQLGGSGFSIGIVIMLVQTLVSAVACILAEILLKEMRMPTDLLNTCMYLWGFVWLTVVMMCQQGYREVYYNFTSPDAWSKLQGDPWMIGSICCLIAFGIVTSYLLKELSNFVKELSRSFVLFACTALQWIIVGRSAMTTLSVLGMVLAVLGVCVYNTDPVQNKANAKPHETTSAFGPTLEQKAMESSAPKLGPTRD